jgi:Tol biopolymer transport system component
MAKYEFGKRISKRSITALVAVIFAVGAAGFGLPLLRPQAAEAAFPGQNGRFVYNDRGSDGQNIFSINPDGSDETQLTFEDSSTDARSYWPSYSPDGSKVVFARNTPVQVLPESGNPAQSDIYIMNSDGTAIQRLTSTDHYEGSPVFSPNGTQIVFVGTVNSYGESPGEPYSDELYAMNIDGSNVRQITTTPNYFVGDPGWSPDGSRIAYTRISLDYFTFQIAVSNINAANAEADAVVIEEVHGTETTNEFVQFGDWSPDGSKVVFTHSYSSSETGGEMRYEIVYMNADGTNRQLVIIHAPDYSAAMLPVWSPDGSRMAFVAYERSTSVAHIYILDPAGPFMTEVPNTENAEYIDWGVAQTTNQRICHGLTATITGTAAGETINGTAGNDVIAALGGNDTVNGLGGNDTICGGPGNDTLVGNGGADFLSGGNGDDSIDGGNDNDTVNGNAGADTINGGTGDDMLSGAADNDIVNGNVGNDTVEGNTGDDNLSGNGENDLIRGGLGNDTVAGGAGDDTIEGNRGNDTLNGNAGTNQVNGGADTDTCSNGAVVRRCEL